MAVLIEAISVVVKVDSILDRLANGWDDFTDLVPNGTLCCDDEIARVGFMTPDDAQTFLALLKSAGFTYLENDSAVDLVVIDQVTGLASACDWIEYGHINLDGQTDKQVAACRLVESNEDQLFTPDGWTFEQSLSRSHGFVPAGQENRSLEFLRHEGGLDVYLDELTGKEVFVGRTGER